MTVSSSITNAVVVLVIVIVVIGLLLGVAVSGSDWVNPKTAEAKWEQINEQTRHQQALNELEESRLEQQIAFEIERQRARQEAELKLIQRGTDVKLKAMEIREQALTGAGVVAVAILSVGVAAMLGLLGYRWSGMGQPGSRSATALSEDNWKSKAYRDARIEIARANEVHDRTVVARAATAQAQSASSDNGRQEPVPSGMNHPASDDRIA